MSDDDAPKESRRRSVRDRMMAEEAMGIVGRTPPLIASIDEDLERGDRVVACGIGP